MKSFWIKIMIFSAHLWIRRTQRDLAEPSAHELEFLVGKSWSTVLPWSTSQLRDCLAVSALSPPVAGSPSHCIASKMSDLMAKGSIFRVMPYDHMAVKNRRTIMQIPKFSTASASPPSSAVCLLCPSCHCISAPPQAASWGTLRDITILWLVLTAPIVSIMLIFLSINQDPLLVLLVLWSWQAQREQGEQIFEEKY